jgi:hypothetical protein
MRGECVGVHVTHARVVLLRGSQAVGKPGCDLLGIGQVLKRLWQQRLQEPYLRADDHLVDDAAQLAHLTECAEAMVRRLAAGGRRIRTLSPASENAFRDCPV